jgi:GrpB-like predicted nucleotidyltransferase (UPF0157 family)
MKNHNARGVEVVDYDPCWPTRFETLRARIVAALGSLADSIEHVGSTSVPGLAAKPIIDIDVVVVSAIDVPAAIERLALLGYLHRGNLGIDGREAFESPPRQIEHNLYLCIRGSTALSNHLTVRDYLRHNPEAAMKYGILKKRLAKQFPMDIDRCIDGKTDLLVGALREAGFAEPVLSAIRDVNRVKS